jgi:translation initiation factor 3 subunit B
VAIWGGPNWTRINRFAHPQVRLIDFSPNEKYLISYTSVEPTNPRDSFSVDMKVGLGADVYY